MPSLSITTNSRSRPNGALSIGSHIAYLAACVPTCSIQDIYVGLDKIGRAEEGKLQHGQVPDCPSPGMWGTGPNNHDFKVSGRRMVS